MITFTLEMTCNQGIVSQATGTGLACASLQLQNLKLQRYKAIDLNHFRDAITRYNSLLQDLQRCLVDYHSTVIEGLAAQGPTLMGSGVTRTRTGSG